jgi:hypothetical protein
MTALRFVSIALIVIVGSASAAILRLRDEDKHSEGDPTEWMKELRQLQRILPDDREWVESIVGFILTHRGESVDVCNFVQVGCTVHHEIESLNIDQAAGHVVWREMPPTVTFVAFSNGKFTDSFSLKRIPQAIQSLKYTSCAFDVRPSDLPHAGDEHDGPLDGEHRAVVLTTPAPEADDAKAAVNLHELVVRRCNLTTIDWASLPSLAMLDVSGNKFSDIPFKSLPNTLRILNLSNAIVPGSKVNPWEGLPDGLVSVDLSGAGIETIGKLPRNLEELFLSRNRLSGQIDVDKMSERLRKLDLSHNALTSMPNIAVRQHLRYVDVTGNKIQKVNFMDLPSDIVQFRAANNNLEGTVDLTKLPRDLVHLDLSFNQLSGGLDFTKLPKRIDTLNLQANQFSGTVDFTNLPTSTRFLYVQRNKLTGRPDLSKLPVDLRRILFGDNQWTSLMPRR